MKRSEINLNPGIGRYPGIEEDEPAVVRLVSDSPTLEHRQI
jgi:hypothetical protein